MAITYRTAGPWGPGKGSDMDAAEIDTNFYTLEQAIQGIIDNPPTPVSIDHFVVEGSLLTIVTTDGTNHGPFVLPLAQWRWIGPWPANTTLFVGDLFQDEFGNLYFTRVQHTTGDTFDPGMFTGEGQVYQLVMQSANGLYDVGMYWKDTVPGGTAIIMQHIVVRSFWLPINCLGSIARLENAPEDLGITLRILQSGTQVGTLTFGLGQTEGLFETMDSEPIQFSPGQRLSIQLPTENDSAARDLTVTLVGHLGVLAL